MAAQNEKVVAPEDFNAFVDHFESNSPKENAKAIAAYLYGQYGLEPFTLQEVRDRATEGRLTIPSRIDMTFVEAREGGKKLFKRAGKGLFRPTVHGESYFKETFGVRKGKKTRPKQDEK